MQQIDETLVLLNPLTGHYYTLNEVGARIWELLDGTRTQDEIVNVLSAEYEAADAEIRADVDDLLADLRDEELIDEEQAA